MNKKADAKEMKNEYYSPRLLNKTSDFSPIFLISFLKLEIHFGGKYSNTCSSRFIPTIPTPGYAVPTPGCAVPTPGYAVPNVGYAVPKPGYTVPKAGYAVPKLGYAVPKAGYAVPKPGYAVPSVGIVVQIPVYNLKQDKIK